MEGDIIVYDNNELEEYDDYGDAVNDTSALWNLDPATGTVPIPYMISNNIDSQTREKIEHKHDSKGLP